MKGPLSMNFNRDVLRLGVVVWAFFMLFVIPTTIGRVGDVQRNGEVYSYWNLSEEIIGWTGFIWIGVGAVITLRYTIVWVIKGFTGK